MVGWLLGIPHPRAAYPIGLGNSVNRPTVDVSYSRIKRGEWFDFALKPEHPNPQMIYGI